MLWPVCLSAHAANGLTRHCRLPVCVRAATAEVETPAQRRTLLRQAIVCADLNHSTRPLERHLVWTQLLMEEFGFQAEEEGLLSIKSAMPMPRTLGALATSQCGFIAFLVRPVYAAWEGFWGTTVHSDRLASTLQFWSEISEPARACAPVHG